MDRADGTLRTEPGQIALGLLQDARHGADGDAQNVGGAAAEEAGAVRDKQQDRAGKITGLRLPVGVLVRCHGAAGLLVGVFAVFVFHLAQYAAQCSAGPVGEGRLFEYGQASAEEGCEQPLGGEGLFGYGGLAHRRGQLVGEGGVDHEAAGQPAQRARSEPTRIDVGAQAARRGEKPRRLVQGLDTVVPLVRGERTRPPLFGLLKSGKAFLDGLGK